MIDELYDNNIPSGSDGEGLESDDGETETDELDQLCTIVCTIVHIFFLTLIASYYPIF